jgi:hypothetical protein
MSPSLSGRGAEPVRLLQVRRGNDAHGVDTSGSLILANSHFFSFFPTYVRRKTGVSGLSAIFSVVSREGPTGGCQFAHCHAIAEYPGESLVAQGVPSRTGGRTVRAVHASPQSGSRFLVFSHFYWFFLSRVRSDRSWAGHFLPFSYGDDQFQ